MIMSSRTNDFDKPIKACDVEMDWHQPIFTTSVKLSNTGEHPTRGLELRQDEFGPFIYNCQRGTPAANVPYWQRHLKKSLIHSIDGHIIKSIDDVIQAIKMNTQKDISLRVIPAKPTDIHDETGLLQHNFDQFINVASHHHDIIHGQFKFIVDNELGNIKQVQISKLIKKNLTRTELLKRPDWKQ